MSSLPLISHHLFVQAVGHEERAPREATRERKPPMTLKGIATALPLELLDSVNELPPAARKLRASLSAGET